MRIRVSPTLVLSETEFAEALAVDIHTIDPGIEVTPWSWPHRRRVEFSLDRQTHPTGWRLVVTLDEVAVTHDQTETLPAIVEPFGRKFLSAKNFILMQVENGYV